MRKFTIVTLWKLLSIASAVGVLAGSLQMANAAPTKDAAPTKKDPPITYRTMEEIRISDNWTKEILVCAPPPSTMGPTQAGPNRNWIAVANAPRERATDCVCREPANGYKYQCS
jgi:hypothetical protein